MAMPITAREISKILFSILLKFEKIPFYRRTKNFGRLV